MENGERGGIVTRVVSSKSRSYFYNVMILKKIWRPRNR